MHRRKNMTPADKAAALAQRVSWTEAHWAPFFSDMPYRIPSLGSLRNPFGIIARKAENSAIFSATDVSETHHLLTDESALSAAMEEL
jgi:hypothetical protein